MNFRDFCSEGSSQMLSYTGTDDGVNILCYITIKTVFNLFMPDLTRNSLNFKDLVQK